MAENDDSSRRILAVLTGSLDLMLVRTTRSVERLFSAGARTLLVSRTHSELEQVEAR